MIGGVNLVMSIASDGYDFIFRRMCWLMRLFGIGLRGLSTRLARISRKLRGQQKISFQGRVLEH